jgi:hypothetical protein
MIATHTSACSANANAERGILCRQDFSTLRLKLVSECASDNPAPLDNQDGPALKEIMLLHADNDKLIR